MTFLAVLLLAIAPAAASDYSNVCRTADDSYEIDDGELRAVDPAGKQTPAIPYTKLRETVLSHETGHCLSDAAKGQTFKYESKSSVLRIAFTADGQKREADFICELAADGLPAAYSCDRRVVTTNSKAAKADTVKATRTAASAPDPASVEATRGRRWLHNGSLMRLEASGDQRRFVYVAPRAGMRDVGVKPGTLLFDGTLVGAVYSGTAYVFAANCPPQGYAVTGRVSDGGRRVVLTGEAPRLGPSCNATGSRDDTLVFSWKP